ncbi:AAA family ATPase [Streptomyces sp. NPDC006990]|uniref:AAA family ATPase n=1 Tax=unclassified Streptomyces TaxID=2593676 RepID=UPI00345455EA
MNGSTWLKGFEETVSNDPRLAPKGLFHRGGAEGRAQGGTFTIEVGVIVPSPEGPLPLWLWVTVAREEQGRGRPKVPLLVRGSAVKVSGLQPTTGHGESGWAMTVWRRSVAVSAGVIEGLSDVRPYLIERRDEFDFEVEFERTGWMVPSLLSDGTLRMLGLLAASADPLRPGTLCVEELESGMRPAHIADLVRRL